MISIDRVKELAEERIAELNNGCYLVDVVIESGNKIIVHADNEERGIAVEDCVSISRNIEHNLDREEEDFELEVSSPGLDQPLRVWKQFKRNVGREVKVKSEESKIQGTLISADEEGFTVQVETKERVEGKKKKIKVVNDHTFKYTDNTETRIVIAFK